MRLAIPQITTGHGKLSATIDARLASPESLPERAAEMARNAPVFGLFRRLSIDGEAFTDQTLLHWVLDQIPREQSGLRQSVTAQIDALVEQDLLLRRDERLGVTLHLSPDAFVVNDRTIPPQQLQPLFESLTR